MFTRLAGLTVLTLALLTPTAIAQTNYPLADTIVITDVNGTVITGSDAVGVGQTLTVTATGWQAGAGVVLSFMCSDGDVLPLGIVDADFEGVVTSNFRVPAGTSGDCTLFLRGIGSNGAERTMQAPLLVRGVVVASATAVADSELGRTGADLWSRLMIGFALLALGTTLVLAVRRRREPLSVS